MTVVSAFRGTKAIAGWSQDHGTWSGRRLHNECDLTKQRRHGSLAGRMQTSSEVARWRYAVTVGTAEPFVVRAQNPEDFWLRSFGPAFPQHLLSFGSGSVRGSLAGSLGKSAVLLLSALDTRRCAPLRWKRSQVSARFAGFVSNWQFLSSLGEKGSRHSP